MLLLFLAAACLTVPGPKITARDLARAVPEFVPKDPEAVVAYSPDPGVERVFYAGELRASMAHLGYETSQPLENVCFVRPVSMASEAAVVMAMKDTLGQDARIDVLEMSKFPVPQGDLVFPRQELGPGPTAIWRGYVKYDEGKKFPLWARVGITVKYLRAVAREELKPGTPIASSQIQFVPEEGFPENRSTPQTIAGLQAYVPKHFIPVGSPVWIDALDPPNEVWKGDRVMVVIRSGLAHLSMDAEAQSSGRHGQLIALKNPESGKLFRARVEGPGQAGIDTLPVNQ